MSSQSLRKAVASTFVSYMAGAALYCLGLGKEWFDRGAIHDRAWWQHALFPALIVLLLFSLETVGTFLASGFSFRGSSQPKWRRFLGLFGLFLFLSSLVLGPALYRIGFTP